MRQGNKDTTLVMNHELYINTFENKTTLVSLQTSRARRGGEGKNKESSP